MRNETNVEEWFIALKEDGRIFLAHEIRGGGCRGGILSEEQAAAFRKLVGKD